MVRKSGGTGGNNSREVPNREELTGLLEPLPDAPRRDYIAVEIDGCTPSEQAESLEIDVATVCQNVSRAKTQIKEIYDLKSSQPLASAFGEAKAVSLSSKDWELVVDLLKSGAATRRRQGGERDAERIQHVHNTVKAQLGWDVEENKE